MASIKNQVYAVSVYVSASPDELHYVAVDGNGKLGVDSNLIAGSTVVAGQANTHPYPSPAPAGGSLISHTGAGTGELLLGASANYVRCDYGGTTMSVLTCNEPEQSRRRDGRRVGDFFTGPVPPGYDHLGTSSASTFHIVKNMNSVGVETRRLCDTWCSLSNNSIVLSSAADFASANYSCALSSISSYKLILMVNRQTTSGFTIQAYNVDPGGSINPGTDLGIEYACSGD